MRAPTRTLLRPRRADGLTVASNSAARAARIFERWDSIGVYELSGDGPLAMPGEYDGLADPLISILARGADSTDVDEYLRLRVGSCRSFRRTP